MESKKRDNMTEAQTLVMYEAWERYWIKNPEQKQCNWTIILDDSGLGNAGYNAKDLGQRYQNLKKFHGVINLNDCRNYLATRRGGGVFVRRRPDPVVLPPRKPKQPCTKPKSCSNVGGAMENQPEENLQKEPSSDSIAMDSINESDQGEEMIADLHLGQKESELSIEAKLATVAKVVSGPVMNSIELWEYFGGNRVIPYDAFTKLALKEVGRSHAGIPITFKVGSAKPTRQSMDILKSKFGHVFDREEASEKPRSSNAFNLASGTSAQTHCVIDGSVIEADSNPAQRPREVTENLAEDMNFINEMLFPSDDEDILVVNLTDDSEGVYESTCSPKPGTPITVTPKRKRDEFEPARRKEFRRDWTQDPLRPIGGYEKQHPGRRFEDSEWKLVLATDKPTNRLTALKPKDWKRLFDKLGIPTSKDGHQIMLDFYSNVVPRIRDDFGDVGKTARMKLENDMYSMIVIYHTIEERTLSGIRMGVRKLLEKDILSGSTDEDLNHWASTFVEDHLFHESGDFFNTGSEDMKNFRSSVLAGIMEKR